MKLYPRNLFDQILPKLDGKEAIFIFGARQCGKTTLLRQLMHELGEAKSLYIDIEYPETQTAFRKGISEVLKYLRYHRKSGTGRTFVFIDEVQYISDLSQTIKLLVDHHADEFKLVMTGSSSALIKHQFRESLVGRKHIFELYPLSFDEFLRFKEEGSLTEYILTSPEALPVSEIKRLAALAEEYILFGSFPKLVLTPETDGKRAILLDLVSSSLIKDLKHLFQIEKMDNLNHLIRYLAVNIGREISLKALATEVGLHRETLSNYLMILEESYIIKILKPFYSNLSTELRKSPKVYFVDTGIRNVLLPNFNGLESRVDRGSLFENFVYLNLFHTADPFTEIRYWRTRNKQEVDFVVRREKVLRAYECKFSGGKSVSWRAFLNAYPQAERRTVVLNNADQTANEMYGWQKLL